MAGTDDGSLISVGSAHAHHHHTSVKGLIVREGKVLLVEYHDEAIGIHYNIPGGRQRQDESAHEALRRKLLEEAGARIAPGPLLFVYEYIGKNHDFELGRKHSVSLVFQCSLEPGSEPSMELVSSPEKTGARDPANGRWVVQTGLRWVAVADLKGIQLFPGVQGGLAELLSSGAVGDRYFGDVV
jgi:8-oxo-dGTP diphosphatase